MKYKYYFLIFLLLATIFCSCSESNKKESPSHVTATETEAKGTVVELDDTESESQDRYLYGAELLEQNELLYDKVEGEYDSNDIFNYSAKHKTIEEFFEAFNVKYYKIHDGTIYTIINTEEGLVFCGFYNGITCLPEKINFSDSSAEEDIRNIIIGNTELSDVRKIDPLGDYSAIDLSSYSKNPKISDHFFESGYYYSIMYENNKVVDIHSCTI